MNDEQKESLKRVLEYLSDEEKHYEESDKPNDHIYKDILALKEFLEK